MGCSGEKRSRLAWTCFKRVTRDTKGYYEEQRKSNRPKTPNCCYIFFAWRTTNSCKIKVPWKDRVKDRLRPRRICVKKRRPKESTKEGCASYKAHVARCKLTRAARSYWHGKLTLFTFLISLFDRSFWETRILKYSNHRLQVPLVHGNMMICLILNVYMLRTI